MQGLACCDENMLLHSSQHASRAVTATTTTMTMSSTNLMPRQQLLDATAATAGRHHTPRYIYSVSKETLSAALAELKATYIKALRLFNTKLKVFFGDSSGGGMDQ